MCSYTRERKINAIENIIELTDKIGTCMVD